MLNIILSHPVTYVFLAYLFVVAAVNFYMTIRVRRQH
jgi:hypothetical protein